MDVAELFVKGLRLGLPREPDGLVARLREAAILEPDDAALLSQMKAFRNRLVHRYGKLDDAKVFANVLRAPEEFRRLARAFRAAADEHAGRPGGTRDES